MSYNNRGRGSYQQAGRPQPTAPSPDIRIKEIVEDDKPDLLVEEAQKLARKMGGQDDATKTQIRRLFTTMRQIEMTWSQDEASAYRQLILLQPRLVYQTSKKEPLKPLSETLQAGIQSVGHDRARLERLVQFFEATLAYWIGIKGGF